MKLRGRIAKARPILGVRELRREDLAALREKRDGTPNVLRFRDPHHRLARLFATGLRQAEVAARSGYSYNRVHQLSADPAFQDLVAKYRKMVDQAFVESVDDYYELATGNMLKAERQIAEKLEEADEAGETLPVKDLIAISRDAADRFGYGKKQTNLNVNVDFAAQLEKAIQRSGKVIEGGRPVTSGSQHPSPAVTGRMVDLPHPPSTPLAGGVSESVVAPKSSQRTIAQPRSYVQGPLRRRA